MPRVSIVIPVYRTEQYLPACLDSCIAQSFDDFEIIAVNDGSPDDCHLILEKYSNIDSRIKIISQPNQGAVKARQSGVEAAQSEYIFFLDSDDTITFDALEVLLANSNGHDVVVGDLCIKTCNNKPIKTLHNNLPFGSTTDGLMSALLSKTIVGSLCGRLIRRELVSNVKISSTFSIGEDFIVNMCLFSNPISIQIVNQSIYNYFQYYGSAINTANEKTARARMAFMEWILAFMEQFKENPQLVNSTAQFAIEEYFSYLRDGGKTDYRPEITYRINSEFLKNKWATNRLPFWRVLMVRCYKFSPLLGRAYRFIFVELRKKIK